MGCTDPEGFGKWNPVFYPEKVSKGLTFFFFLKDRREDAAGFSKEWPLRSENQDMETF